MAELTNHEIFEGIKAGDEKVIQYLIKCYFPKIKRFILKNKGNLDDAKDVLQEVLVIVYEKLKRNDLTINCKFGTYLFGIVKIVWIKELNKRGKIDNTNVIIEESKVDTGIFNLIETRERHLLYRKYYEKLGEECKKLLDLFFKGIKIKEITQIMGFNSDQHTKNKKYICKKHLIENIRSNPTFKEIKNERLNNITEIPRW